MANGSRLLNQDFDEGQLIITSFTCYISYLTTEKTSTVGNYVYLADLDDQGLIRHVGSHLACFYAGNWLLGNIENAFRSPRS